MRGVYSLKTLSFDGTAPLYTKVLRTFSSLVFVLNILTIISIALILRRSYPAESFNAILRLFAFSLGLYSIACILIVGVLVKSGYQPLSRIIEWVNRADSLETVALPENTSREIQEVHQILNATLERLSRMQSEMVQSERLAAIGKTTQMIAHDIRKPFTALKMGLMVLDSETELEQIREQAKSLSMEVSAAIQSVETMLAEIMDLGGASLSLKPQSESPITSIEAALAEAFRFKTGLEISLSYDFKHTRTLWVDVPKTGRIFSNLVENAIQATGSTGRIWFQTSDLEISGKHWVEIKIGNTGPAIPAEQLKQIFEPFFTRGKKRGIGLGLAIAARMVTLHGGKIQCHSREGFGTEFIVKLPASDLLDTREPSLPGHSSQLKRHNPLVEEKDADRRLLSYQTRIRKQIEERKEKARILVIDDESIYLRGVERLIEKDKQLENCCEFTGIGSANESLPLIKNLNPDLVICDIDLGPNNEDGYAVVSRMRKEGFNGMICMHSNRSHPHDYRRAIDVGANTFLPKPLSHVHLMGLIADSIDGGSHV